MGVSYFEAEDLKMNGDEEGNLPEEVLDIMDEIVEVIKKGLDESGIKANFAIIGLFGHNVVSKRLQLAGGTPEDIDDQINWEGDQYFPFSMDQCSYGFHVFGENQAGGVDVFVGASRTDILENFKNLDKYWRCYYNRRNPKTYGCQLL